MARYSVILICVFGISIGQILFKKISLLLQSGNGIASMKVLTLTTTAAIIYGGATLLWIWALRDVSLSRAYLFMALCFVLVPGMSWYYFDEPIKLNYLIGTLLVILGIIIAVRSD